MAVVPEIEGTIGVNVVLHTPAPGPVGSGEQAEYLKVYVPGEPTHVAVNPLLVLSLVAQFVGTGTAVVATNGSELTEVPFAVAVTIIV